MWSATRVSGGAWAREVGASPGRNESAVNAGIRTAGAAVATRCMAAAALRSEDGKAATRSARGGQQQSEAAKVPTAEQQSGAAA